MGRQMPTPFADGKHTAPAGQPPPVGQAWPSAQTPVHGFFPQLSSGCSHVALSQVHIGGGGGAMQPSPGTTIPYGPCWHSHAAGMHLKSPVQVLVPQTSSEAHSLSREQDPCRGSGGDEEEQLAALATMPRDKSTPRPRMSAGYHRGGQPFHLWPMAVK
jgi:hypothetical protein